MRRHRGQAASRCPLAPADRADTRTTAKLWRGNLRSWIELLAANPSLIQRPIVITDDGRAIVARSPEAISDALG
ncbi:arsenate reductase family protein [Herbihabitans rhizosphaerae]|uniref:arsenate reductase family protein n=1 Tax=Herbihabitans rhizosphaerae TaxID=1872711 RepID=UPI0030FE7A88